MSRDGAAFPLQLTVASGHGGVLELTGNCVQQFGMSKLEYFAAAALTGINANPNPTMVMLSAEQRAFHAEKDADALLARLKADRE